jgi:hypothetical protein
METCLKTPALLEWSRMMSRSQLIFDKLDSICLRTEESFSHVKTEKFRSNIHQSMAAEILVTWV